MPDTTLRRTEADEVSNVPRGANDKPIAFIKEHDVADPLSNKAITKSLDDIITELPLGDGDTIDADIEKADDMDDAEKRAAKSAIRLLAKLGDKVKGNAAFQKRLAKLAGIPVTKEVIKEVQVVPATPLSKLLKEDGSVDDEALKSYPEEQRQVMEAMAKEAADNRRRTTEAEKIAKEERELREKKDFLAKSAELKNLPGKVEDRGTLLHRLHKADPELAKEVGDELAKANTALSESELLKEYGRGYQPTGEAMAQLETLAKELVTKAAGSMTKEQAFAKAIDTEEGKRLYNQYLQETQG